MGRRFRRKAEERAIARRRIARLFAVAELRLDEADAEGADRAVALARRIAMRYQTGLRPDERDRYCRACGAYLSPGRTARIRLGDGQKRTTCLRCMRTWRRPYRREQKERRAARAAAAAAPPGPGPTPDP